MELRPWEHFISENLSQLGSQEWSLQPWDFIIHLATEELKSGSNRLEPGKKQPHRKVGEFHIIIFLSPIQILIIFSLAMLAYPHTELWTPEVFIQKSVPSGLLHRKK